MDSPGRSDAQDELPAWRVVVCGVAALAVAMGIGRFAFTPLMPLMLRDGTLEAAAGAEWAVANYLGYLAGALTAGRFAREPRVGLQWGLAGVVATTLAGPWAGPPHPPIVGALLRGAAGVFSAWVLVSASSWGLSALARRQQPRLGAWLYTGVGLGIALAGGLAWAGGRQPAAWLWLELGLMAAAGWAVVAPVLRRDGETVAPSPAAGSGVHAPAAGARGLVFCYGVFGFGYIVPATFLPAMARQQVDDPLVFGLTWPLFGLAAALSVAGAARWLAGWPRRRLWALAQGVMAMGTALPLAGRSLWLLAASAVLVGGTFMVATMAGLQLAREHRPADPTPLLARMTVAFALGQIAGPLLVRAIGGAQALAWSHAAATLLLLATMAWLWRGGRVSSPPIQNHLSEA
jgi:MFS family permease